MQQGMSYTRRDGKAMGALQRKPDHRESNLMIPRQMPNYSSCPLGFVSPSLLFIAFASRTIGSRISSMEGKARRGTKTTSSQDAMAIVDALGQVHRLKAGQVLAGIC
jgi:hypothetical protein